MGFLRGLFLLQNHDCFLSVLGVIGLANVGKGVAKVALALGMKVIA